MPSFRLILLLILFALTASGCSIQKRRYLNGFHIERRGIFRQAKSAVGEALSNKETESIRPEIAAVPSLSHSPQTDSLPDEPIIDSRETVYVVLPSTHSESPLIIEKTESKTPVFNEKSSREQAQKQHIDDVTGGVIILLLLLICPPLWAAYAFIRTFPIILCFFIWAAIDVLIILLVPGVLWIVLAVLAWHIIYLILMLEVDK